MPLEKNELLFAAASVIQKGEAMLFYQWRKDLNGYLVAAIICAPNTYARIDLTRVMSYWFKEIVKDRDAYCSLFLDGIIDIFPGQLHYAQELNGLSVFKIDRSKFKLPKGTSE